ncbi:immunity 42 family protein [Lonsdalea quercina]|uniref:immunity 42 family protein n=1 Tax=Lonsdalea quercina TaxID=71657 RepID=UPI0039760EAE
MIFGQPFEFAVFYEVLEKTENDYWKYGIFSFFIEDEIYPSKGSNYTLHMAINYLKESQRELNGCKNTGLNLSDNASELIAQLAHSHGMLLDSDSEDLELPESESLGIFLSPLEISDTGFYLFYCPKDKNEEYLIYSSDYGKTAKKTILKKGTVNSVIEQLPNKEAI